MALIKKHVVKEMMERTGYDEGTCRHALNAMLETIVDGCKRDGEVRLNGFGVFRSLNQPERVITHPGSGKKITVPPKRRLHFNSAKPLD